MIPARYAPILFGLLLSGIMSFMVSGIATYRAIGLTPDFMSQWTAGWLPSWAIAFPIVLFVAPLARRIVGMLVAKE